MHDLGRWIALLGTAAVVVLTCGCSGGTEPSTLPDVTPEPTAVPTDSPAPTAKPTPTADPTAALEAELVAFYQSYDAALNASWQSIEALSDRRAMFADSCAACLSGYEMTNDAVEQGLTFEGDPSEILDIAVSALDGDSASLLVMTDVPAGKLVDPDGNSVRTFPPNPEVQIVYEVQRAAGTWLIVRSEVL